MSGWGLAVVLFLMCAYGILVGYTVRPVVRRRPRRGPRRSRPGAL